MPRLVLCHCDPDWTALAVCEKCAKAERDALVRKEALIARDYIAMREAFNALIASYDRTDHE